jgi:hypothetical protein
MRLRKEGVRPAGRAFAGRRPGVALAAAGLLALSLTSAVAVSPANAAPVHLAAQASLPSGTWSFENWGHSGYCLTSGGVHNGKVTVYTCNSSSNQHWHAGSSHGSYQQFINGDGQCLSISGGSASAGADAVMANCSTNDSGYWATDFPQIYNIPHFLNQHSQLVIQIACNCSGNSKVVDQESYNGGADGVNDTNQGWQLETF